MNKIHLNSLFNNVLEKLNIHLSKELRDINLESVDEEGRSNFLSTEDIVKMIPKVKDYRYINLQKQGADAFPYSINVLLDLARKLDADGKKSQWFMIGG